jgi:hypothetical protein
LSIFEAKADKAHVVVEAGGLEAISSDNKPTVCKMGKLEDGSRSIVL